jgi:hypothetical protein
MRNSFPECYDENGHEIGPGRYRRLHPEEGNPPPEPEE